MAENEELEAENSAHADIVAGLYRQNERNATDRRAIYRFYEANEHLRKRVVELEVFLSVVSQLSHSDSSLGLLGALGQAAKTILGKPREIS